MRIRSSAVAFADAGIAELLAARLGGREGFTRALRDPASPAFELAARLLLAELSAHDPTMRARLAGLASAC